MQRLSAAKEKKLIAKFSELLGLIIDERSLQLGFGESCKRIKNTTHSPLR
jgi:hypothetical protein